MTNKTIVWKTAIPEIDVIMTNQIGDVYLGNVTKFASTWTTGQ